MRDRLPETGRQTAEERRSMTGGHELVAGGTSFGLRALRGQQVTETGRAADQLTRSGYLEALGNGLFCLLHEESGGKQRTPARLASVMSDKIAPRRPNPLKQQLANHYGRRLTGHPAPAARKWRPMKKIKVAQFGLGPIGLESLKLAAEQSWIEIVGAVDNDPKKFGRSLVELTGLPLLDGLNLCPTLEELFREAQPDVILHTASSSAAATLQQIRPALELGLAVASTCEELIFPAWKSPALAQELQTLCLYTKARLVATGVNPGFVMDLLPICLTGVCRTVDKISVERVVDATTRRQPLQRKIGSGQDPVEFRARLAAGLAGHAGLSESVALVAHALGWKLEVITAHSEPVLAVAPIRTEFFAVAPGRVCGIHQHATGTVAGAEKIVLDLKMYLQAPAPHDTIIVSGRPNLHVVIAGGVAGDDATIASLINVVPRLLAAPPGFCLLHELAGPRWTGGAV